MDQKTRQTGLAVLILTLITLSLMANAVMVTFILVNR